MAKLTLFVGLLFLFLFALSSGIRLPSDEPDSDPAILLTQIRVRTVDRRFQRRPLPMAFRHGRPCRGRHTIPYGHDMILSSDAGSHSLPLSLPLDDHRFPGPHMDLPPRHHHHHHEREREREHEHEYDLGNGLLKGLRKLVAHF